MVRQMSTRVLNTRQNRKTLTPPPFPLLLLHQSYLGYLLTDKAEKLERTVARARIQQGVIGRLWALEPSESEFTNFSCSQPQFHHLQDGYR